MAKLVSKVYGDALFLESVQKQNVNSLFIEVKALLLVWRENPGLSELLDNPRISKEEKAIIIKNVFSGRISDDLVGFLMIITDKGRRKEIPAICEYVINAIKEYKKIGVAQVVSAVELKREQKSSLEKRLLKTTQYVEFEMEYSVDPSLIGGLVIRIGDRVVDSSIKTQIHELHRSLSKLQLS